MQDSTSTTEVVPITGFRRRRPLPPIKTAFIEDEIAHVQRPPPIETVIYKNSPESAVETSSNSKRQSRNILGIFGRNKQNKDEHKEENVAAQPISPMAVRTSQDRSKRMSYLRRDRPQKPEPTADTLPFCEALPKATRHITLAVPTKTADDLLKLHKQKKDSQNIVTEEADLYLGMKAPEPKHRPYADSTLDWMASIFILTNYGLLLQYSAVGLPERQPEHFIQLNSGSAAFASDVIPGKHWVLQVSRSFTEESSGNHSRSRFSRMGLRSGKPPTNNMLLVMEKAEDMDSWLTAVRKEITSQGSETYQTEIVGRKTPIDVMKQLQERPSRRFVIESNPSITKHTSPKVQYSYDTPGAALESQRALTASLSTKRPGLPHLESYDSALTVVDSTVPEHRNALHKLNSSNTPPESPPAPKTANSSLLEWQLPANFSPTFTPTSAAIPSSAETYEQRPSEDYYTRSYRSPSIASDGTPNFSVPSFSHRFSQSTRSGTLVMTPPQSSGSSYRAPSPTHTAKDQNTANVLPIMVPSDDIQDAHSNDMNAFDYEWCDSEEVVSSRTVTTAGLPKRFSSLLLLDEAVDATPKELQEPERNLSTPTAVSPNPLVRLNSSRTKHNSLIMSHLRDSETDNRRHSAMDCISRAVSDDIQSSPTSDSVKSLLSIPYQPTGQSSRPQSMQIPGDKDHLRNRISISTLSPPSSNPTKMTIRERRSFAGRVPSHLLGPPRAPPPTDPLPAIPRPKTAVAGY